jgi:hypothetical protein
MNETLVRTNFTASSTNATPLHRLFSKAIARIIDSKPIARPTTAHGATKRSQLLLHPRDKCEAECKGMRGGVLRGLLNNGRGFDVRNLREILIQVCVAFRLRNSEHNRDI